MITVACIGNITFDSIVLYKRKESYFDFIGGNVLGSSIGAILGTQNRVIAFTSIGNDLDEETLDLLDSTQVDFKINHISDKKTPRFINIDFNGSKFYPIGRSYQEYDSFLPSLKELAAFPETIDRVHIAPLKISYQLELVKLLLKRGVRLISIDTLELQPKELATLHELLDHVDFYIPSLDEIAHLFPAMTLKEMIHSLERSKAKVIIKDGANGSYILEQGELVNIPSYKTDTVNETGAGDIFCGSFISNYQEDGGVLEAIFKATSVASLIVEKVGVDISILKTKQYILDEREAEIQKNCFHRS